MSEFQHRIDFLHRRLQDLAKYQTDVHHEIRRMQAEIDSLKEAAFQADAPGQAESKSEALAGTPVPEPSKYISPFSRQANVPAEAQAAPAASKSGSDRPPAAEPDQAQPKERSDLEKFIGENLISKIGIVITVLGVGIGTKYAIDNNLISPWTRIFLGYLFGFALLALAMRLKEKYLNFSAVLLSGSMAIMYFVTFFAFGLYQLISQPAAFALMLIFTVFTVFMALAYDRVIIAHFGLVGAYAVPFLLSTGSSNYAFLFSYIAIINLGILGISVKKYWRSIFYTSFAVTWLVFLIWHGDSYRTSEHFSLAMTFASLFFLIFYLMFLAYKSFSGEAFSIANISLILANSFVFYGLGVAIIEGRPGGEEYLGLFTVANALVHFVIGFGAARFNLMHRSGVLLMTALVLIFLTIAIPVQFHGNWITLLWTAEAFFLFWLGRVNKVPIYELFSYPLMFLAAVSLLNDWSRSSVNFEGLPIANPDFLTSIIFTAAFAAIHFVNQRFKPVYNDSPNKEFFRGLHQVSLYAIPAIALFALYNTFRIEIANYFQFQTSRARSLTAPPGANSDAYPVGSADLDNFNIVAQIDYSMFFVAVLSFVNIRKIRDSFLGFATLGLGGLAGLIFISLGLFVLSLLRESYLHPAASAASAPGFFNIGVRYVSLAFFAGVCISAYRSIKQEFLTKYIPAGILLTLFDLALYFCLWIIASFELINWMAIFGFTNSYKLGLSILWGLYAVFLIVLGIYYNKKHLRISAIALLAATLAKLFVYDLADLDTISKTVVFVSLGILLLTVSFLYNKYKHLMIEREPSPPGA